MGGRTESVQNMMRSALRIYSGRVSGVLRFWNSEVLHEMEAVKERIWRAVEEYRPHPLRNPPLEGEGVCSASQADPSSEGEGVPLQSRHNSDTPERPPKRKTGISHTLIVLIGYCIIGCSGNAFGRRPCPGSNPENRHNRQPWKSPNRNCRLFESVSEVAVKPGWASRPS